MKDGAGLLHNRGVTRSFKTMTAVYPPSFSLRPLYLNPLIMRRSVISLYFRRELRICLLLITDVRLAPGHIHPRKETSQRCLRAVDNPRAWGAVDRGIASPTSSRRKDPQHSSWVENRWMLMDKGKGCQESSDSKVRKGFSMSSEFRNFGRTDCSQTAGGVQAATF